jgi:hypothetical protein
LSHYRSWEYSISILPADFVSFKTKLGHVGCESWAHLGGRTRPVAEAGLNSSSFGPDQLLLQELELVLTTLFISSKNDIFLSLKKAATKKYKNTVGKKNFHCFKE